MSVLICNFLTQNYAPCFYESLSKYNTSFKDCSFFVASEVCKDWVTEYSVSRLKNKCIDAATLLNVDWMIMMTGIDSSLMEMPDLKNLDDGIIYVGKRTETTRDDAYLCSLYLLSRKIYTKYKYDEFYRFYWDDFDYFYNVTKDVGKKEIDNFLCFHKTHPSLAEDNELVKARFKKEKQMFYLKYKNLYSYDFDDKDKV